MKSLSLKSDSKLFSSLLFNLYRDSIVSHSNWIKAWYILMNFEFLMKCISRAIICSFSDGAHLIPFCLQHLSGCFYRTEWLTQLRWTVWSPSLIPYITCFHALLSNLFLVTLSPQKSRTWCLNSPECSLPTLCSEWRVERPMGTPSQRFGGNMQDSEFQPRAECTRIK